MAVAARTRIDERTLRILARLPERARLFGEEVRRLAAEEAARAARAVLPARSGRLRRSVRVRLGGAYPVVSWGGRRAPYAVYLERGARPHVIEPREARAIVFEAGGEEVFARRVRHPGIRPMGLARRVASRVRAALRRIARQSFSNAFS